MHPRLLTNLDLFREAVDCKVYISPARGALGRHKGPKSMSSHNIDYWSLVLAGDVFIESKVTIEEAFWIARDLKVFSGIGVYPDWRYPSKGIKGGLHLDVRPYRTSEDPALWARVDRYDEAGEVIGVTDLSIWEVIKQDRSGIRKIQRLPA